MPRETGVLQSCHGGRDTRLKKGLRIVFHPADLRHPLGHANRSGASLALLRVVDQGRRGRATVIDAEKDTGLHFQPSM
jgi:hypothetical protein